MTTGKRNVFCYKKQTNKQANKVKNVGMVMKTKRLESQQLRQWSLINELCNDDNQVISHDHMLVSLRCRFRSANVEVNALRRTYSWIK